MTTRVFVNGRLAQLAGAQPDRVLRVQRLVPVDADGAPIAEHLPTTSRPVFDAAAPVADQFGTLYRVVAHMDAREGWASAETVMRWYKGLPFSELSRWVQLGLADGAVLSGTTAKRYRVRDPVRCEAALARHLEKRVRAKVRKALAPRRS